MSSSVKNNRAKQIQIPKIKNQIKSYFQLSTNDLIHTCWNTTAKSNKIRVVIVKTRMNWITNSDLIFLNSKDRVILSTFSLFFILSIRHLRFDKIYHNSITTNINSINSFHIRNNVQNFQFRQSLNVTKVCKKNWSKSQITNILHNKTTQNLKGFEQILDNRDEIFFMIF